MALPNHILACIKPLDESPPFVDYIPTVTKPYVPPTTPSGPNLPDGLHTTHFSYYGDDNAPLRQKLPLPDTRPTQPPQWSAEAWNERIMIGDTHIHILKTNQSEYFFILKVSRNHEGKWIYEDFDPYFIRHQEELNSYITPLLSDLLAQRTRSMEVESDLLAQTRSLQVESAAVRERIEAIVEEQTFAIQSMKAMLEIQQTLLREVRRQRRL